LFTLLLKQLQECYLTNKFFYLTTQFFPPSYWNLSFSAPNKDIFQDLRIIVFSLK